MPKVVKRTFSLTEEQAKFIDSMVERGDYASGSEVVRESVRKMREDDAIIEKWLVEEVLPTIEEMEAHPERLVPLDEAFDRIEAKIRSRTRAAE
ncbi:MAG: type II toxin-antitoxin system ParD family antitoxin [Devosia sp.]|jgi:putative addiction module CopG family antidote|uniref:ribbon-helix-helix domain-containing protein n=1 Tax=Devosia sp. 66-22 TaxID=1895753 RepID=UPI0009268685|nr:type II toxin-antitoxin system ParD family antitoxin [Devosia sp. 66-22]MBN9344679.1 type II toxin-antitoxin system ParD family antitoxin [Devosia sp.]OJX53797.1 MAG: plasmid stabilization protein [Devosia sp. 66-22]